MTTLTVRLPDDVRALAEARATEAGCADVDEYLALLIRGEAADGPAEVRIGSEEDLERLLLSRSDGPSVEMDAADFQRMRARLKAEFGAAPERRE